MFDNYIRTTTYNVSFSLSTLEKFLDSDFLAVLLKTLHIKSLDEANLHVDYINDHLMLSHIEVSEV